MREERPAFPAFGSTAGTPPAVRYRAVAKRYRGRSVLRDVHFSVPSGSSTAVVGLNGVGKSTLLRCLLDFAQPDEGSIEIGGADHRSLASRAALAWLPERFVPPAHLTGRETLRWLAGLRGERLDEARVEASAAAVGLAAQALDRRVGELSKGMTQKVGLMSIGLSGRPVWVLDEPTSGLDPRARQDVASLLAAAHGTGQTVLFTSHDLRDLGGLCDHLVVLHEGTVAFEGPPAELARRHAPGGADAADLESAFLACVGGQGA